MRRLQAAGWLAGLKDRRSCERFGSWRYEVLGAMQQLPEPLHAVRHTTLYIFLCHSCPDNGLLLTHGSKMRQMCPGQQTRQNIVKRLAVVGRLTGQTLPLNAPHPPMNGLGFSALCTRAKGMMTRYPACVKGAVEPPAAGQGRHSACDRTNWYSVLTSQELRV